MKICSYTRLGTCQDCYKAPPYNVHMTAYVIAEQNIHTEDMTHTHILYMTSIAYVYVRALERIYVSCKRVVGGHFQ